MAKQKKVTSSASTEPIEKQASKTSAKPKKSARQSAKLLPSTSIVAIGASAGGLEALEAVFAAAPSKIPAAFVIITHLNPEHGTILPELLQKKTKLKVLQITEDIAVHSNCIYMIPPKKNIVIRQGILKLVERGTDATLLPIDLFFQSLAEEQGCKIIGVILSGTGMDGTAGIRAISAAGGLIVVQDPTTAKYGNMPASAINTSLVDYVLPPDKIVDTILKYLNTKMTKLPTDEKEVLEELQPIFQLLHANVGHDFSLYKYNTICRRIEKHMRIHQINDVATYRTYLQHNPQEIQTLFKDLLIGVTSFFRNLEAFESLRRTLLVKLKAKPKGEDIRVWVPACATGEEVYSIAILLQECMEELHTYFNVQIFGTDIDETAIEIARFGLYPLSIASDLSEQRLTRFFSQEEGRYRISKEIRKMVVFAPQNIIRDPPFTKLDMLSCRNLLIYFTSVLQKKLLPLFYYSLNYNGILFLGSAENISSFVDLFNVVDKKWKIFERKEGNSSLQGPLDFDVTAIMEKPPITHSAVSNPKPKEINIAYLVDNILLENYTPACIVLDDKENIVYIHGRTGKYLEPENGFTNLNILHMVRSELKPKISAALRNMILKKKEVSYNNLQIKDNDISYYINLKVRSLYELDSDQQWKLLIIENAKPPDILSQTVNPKHASTDKLIKQISLLEKELKESKENLQTTIEELETSNEELKSSNEELQSTNEELQSTNEELETSKEELQSLNEELTTVNSELESRIEELSSANDDIQNLLYSTEIASIFLDNALHIKRFTPKATELTSLIQTDIGRPLTDIVSKLKYDTLIEDARKVLDTLHSKTIEVQDKEAQWFQIRIIPYRTLTNMIDGLVITFLNINVQKQAEEKVKQLNKAIHDLYNPIALLIDTMHEPVLMVDENLHIVSANGAFYKTFHMKADKVLNHSIYTIWQQKVSEHQLRQLFEEKLRQAEDCTHFSLSYEVRENYLQKIIINARHINTPKLNDQHILLAINLCDSNREEPL